MDVKPLTLATSRGESFRTWSSESAWRQESGIELAGLRHHRLISMQFLRSSLLKDLVSNIPFLGTVLSGSDLLHAIASALAEGENTVHSGTALFKPACQFAQTAELRSLLGEFPRPIPT